MIPRIRNIHTDILTFQLVNWTSSVVWFSTIAYLAEGSTSSSIAAAEALVGFIGVALLRHGLQQHSTTLNKPRELSYATIRLVLALLATLLIAFIDWIPLAYALAFVTVLCIPTHLPILMQHRWPTIILGTRLPIAAFLLSTYSYQELPAGLAISVYFAPSVLYGTACWLEYLRPRTHPRTFHKTPLASSAAPIRLFSTSFSASILQACVLAHLGTLSFVVTTIERVLRSTISLVLPHVLRSAKHESDRLLSILVCVIATSVVPSLVFRESTIAILVSIVAPAALDVYVGLYSGKRKAIDALIIALTAVAFGIGFMRVVLI